MIPGADPRIQYLYNELGYMLKKEALDELPAALDEIDRAVGIIHIDTRDETTIEPLARHLFIVEFGEEYATAWNIEPMAVKRNWRARAVAVLAVLAALRGGQ